jgi:hypothetical protein
MPFVQHARTIAQNNPGMPRNMRRRLAGLGDFAQAEGVDASMYETPEQMAEDLEERQRQLFLQQVDDNAAQARQRAEARRPPRQAQPMYQEPSMFSPEMQFRSLSGMNNNIMQAFSDENDSRVAQSREIRRMQHEQALAAMRAQVERERNALQQYQIDQDAASQIRQLKLQNYMAKRKMGMPTSRTMVDGRWYEDWEL